ncbi:MAG TPA: MoxR family ATPase [Syntrophomonadaceae bacterium]|nr:MoxR family ATPase [Syntrophomonadaceae bacterium]
MEINLEELREGFARYRFIIKEDALYTVYLALRLEKPLLVGGPPGVGKTELAKVLSQIMNARLIRLQCYEGLDESSALYDWNIQRQLVKIHLSARDGQLREEKLFSLSNILQRPLLQAITSEEQVVLLIDEIDRSDPGFEAFVLEVLSDFQITIPEIGTITATRKPIVVITNNGERELSEPLRRRCVFLYLDFPEIEEEASILKNRAPEVLENLNEEIAMAVAWARDRGHQLGPNAPYAMDWARSLLLLNADSYQKDYIDKTLKALANNKDSLAAFWNQTVTGVATNLKKEKE